MDGLKCREEIVGKKKKVWHYFQQNFFGFPFETVVVLVFQIQLNYLSQAVKGKADLFYV